MHESRECCIIVAWLTKDWDGDNMSSRSVRKTKRTRKIRKNRSLLLYVVLIVITLYSLFLMVDLQIRIKNAGDELNKIEEKIFTQEQTNAELKKVADAVDRNDDKAFADYVEKIAREDLDYVKNGEVVFVNIAGD